MPYQAELTQSQLETVCSLLAERRLFTSGAMYKESYLQRRIVARMHRSDCAVFEQYLERLRDDRLELLQLARALTIQFSQFFRNPCMFEQLRHGLLPGLFARTAPSDDMLRFCSLGCACGEEPYSLAILLAESFSSELENRSVELLAADIDTRSIQRAIRGYYDEPALKEVSPLRRERWFHEDGGRYRLASVIRSMVTFRQMDLAAPLDLAPCMLVLCRNVLIYLNRPAQEIILQRLADILPTGGILVLGKSETLPVTVRCRFTAVNPVERMYRRI